MPTTEHTVNDALAEQLRTTKSAWRLPETVRSENTGMLRDSSERPDILVLETNVSPVAIETELLPATSVESEACARLGKHVRTTGRTILSALAVRLPSKLRNSSGAALRTAVASITDFEIALFTGTSPTSYSRWPQSGWIKGDLALLSALAQAASVPPEVIDRAADDLVNGVNEAAGRLNEIARSHPGAAERISQELRQEDGEQTRRMAMTIVVNALVFQETLAGGPGDLSSVRTLDELRSSRDGLNKSTLLKEWRRILRVNYWPIFDIARRIFEPIPPADAKDLIDTMAATAARLLENRLMRSHDLTGAVFQRLIADRKYLAAFYTTPASAALLIGLAILTDKTPADGDWSSPTDVKQIRVADFACGTGTLLSTAYQRIGQLHELAGGNAEALHPDMMADCIIGCDVLPAATHLTASMLSGTHPTTQYQQSSIFTVAYGKLPSGGIGLGSLDLLDPHGRFEILDITARAVEAMGERERETWRSLRYPSFHLVVMNSPFTRATGQEGKKIGIPNPMFAAFSSSEEEQRLMAVATQRLTKGTSAHGNAGEASIFLLLAHRKLVAGGKLALVMPLSLISGDAWEASRRLLAKNYGDIIVVSIAGKSDKETSFSADTGMAECLVVAQRDKGPTKRATFVVLYSQPSSTLLGNVLAKQINDLRLHGGLRKLEDGPIGGTPLRFGNDLVGQVIDAPLPSSGGWNVARVSDLGLAQAAFQLASHGGIWLPTMLKSAILRVPITQLQAIGTVGPYHSDIAGLTQTGSVRGPFEIEDIRSGTVPTYPILWAHDAPRERTLLFEADCEAVPRVGRNRKEQKQIDDKIASLLTFASHAHFNQNFRFNSQSTGMQFTSVKTLGGRAWLSVLLKSEEHEKALVLWANTSFGLLLHWWHANKQQAGRGNIGRLVLETLPVLNVDALTPSQLSKAAALFDRFRSKPLSPMHEMDTDPLRAQLDEQFGCAVLDLPKSLFALNGPWTCCVRSLRRNHRSEG
jgi:hypothetical protein